MIGNSFSSGQQEPIVTAYDKLKTSNERIIHEVCNIPPLEDIDELKKWYSSLCDAVSSQTSDTMDILDLASNDMRYCAAQRQVLCARLDDVEEAKEKIAGGKEK